MDMIVGIGVDVCDTSRVRDLIERYGDRVISRLFTPGEAARCRNPRRRHECFAGRFAAKEATLKALGTGLSNGIGWKDVELVSGEAQPPRVALHRRAAEIAELRGVTGSHVTISHDAGIAVAVVILMGGGA